MAEPQISSNERSSSGWLRLWVVLSGAMLIVFGIWGFMEIPTAKNISHDRVYFSVARDMRTKLDAADATPASQVAINIRMSNGYIAKIKERVEKQADVPWLVEYQDALDQELLRDRLVFSSKLFLTWAFTCLVTYFLGVGIAWIRRGFATQ
jgi:hypothetical protein